MCKALHFPGLNESYTIVIKDHIYIISLSIRLLFIKRNTLNYGAITDRQTLDMTNLTRSIMLMYIKRIILSMRVFSSKPAISIEFNDVESHNLAGYEERTRVFYMIRKGFIKRPAGL